MIRMRQYPRASQPEIMRAADKDEQYASHLCYACHDAFRHAFGNRLAVAYENETRLAGCVLYYLLTTGSGLQTLGEEYCDIAQVAGPSMLPLAPARRTLLVFFQTVLPYIAERLSAKAASRNVYLSSEISVDFENGGRAASGIGMRHSEGAAARQFSGRINSSMQVRDRDPAGSCSQRLQSLWTAALQRWPRVLPGLRDAFLFAVRANLMLFYFEGVYYQLSKRAAGVRYIHMGKLFYKKPKYHMLGMFLLIQLGIVGGDWLRRTALPNLANSMRVQAMDQNFLAGQKGILVLDEEGNQMLDSELGKMASDNITSMAFSGTSKCSLCLSPRQHPTATPCGHVFCWNCIIDWCNEKTECPLCRSPTLQSDLVCMYNADDV